MEEEKKYYSVTQYNQSIKRFLDEQPGCQDVHIKGEISNWKGATRGHLYFTLKDEESRISAVMFKGAAEKLDFAPKEGDKVLEIPVWFGNKAKVAVGVSDKILITNKNGETPNVERSDNINSNDSNNQFVEENNKEMGMAPLPAFEMQPKN